MSSYKFPESEIINGLSLIKSDGGARRAYLTASPNASPEQLKMIMDHFSGEGYQVVPYTIGNDAALEVRGFQSGDKFLQSLKERSWISGKAERGDDAGKQSSMLDKIKKRSLFASGLAYILGDIKFITYGMKGESPLNIAGGMFYGAGTASSLLFGRKDPSDLQIREISHKMADYLNKQNFEIPPESAISKINDDKDRGVLKRADDVLRRYPAELMNSFFAMAGICIAIAAYKKLRQPINSEQIEQYVSKRMMDTKKNFPSAVLSDLDIAALRTKGEKVVGDFHHMSQWLDIGLGGMTAASGIFANIVKEKKRDPDSPHRQGLQGVWDWIQERPLTIAGVGYMVSTMCHAASTAIEYNINNTNGRKAIFDRGVFVASNLLAEFLVAISSKGHGEGVVSDKSVDETAIAIAADIIMKQPASKHAEIIEGFAHFLGQSKILAMQDSEVRDALLRQVEGLKKNPWAQAEGKSVESEKTHVGKFSKKSDQQLWIARTAVQQEGLSAPTARI